MANRLIPISLTSDSCSRIRIDFEATRESLFAVPFEFNKDTTGLTYKFGVWTKDWVTVFQKDLDIINLVAWQWQLTLTKNTVDDDWVLLLKWDYLYSIKECVDATWGDATIIISWDFTILDEITDC